MQFALLGDVQFELLAYFEGIEGKFGADYAEHALIEGKPRLQWIADRLDGWTIKLKFHHAYCSPETELSRLRAAMGNHAALPFVLATGEYKGEFVITEVTAVSEQTDRLGALVALSATLALKECPDPEGRRAPRATALGLAWPGRPVPPAMMTVVTPARPNVPAADLKDAVMAARAVVGAARAAEDVVVAGRQMAANPAFALARAGAAFGALATAGDTLGARLAPLTGRIAGVGLVSASAARVTSDAKSAMRLATGADVAGFASTLDLLTGYSSGIAREMDRAALTLARMAARVAAREVV